MYCDQALNSIEASPEERVVIEQTLNTLFKRGVEIYQGFLCCVLLKNIGGGCRGGEGGVSGGGGGCVGAGLGVIFFLFFF